MDRKHLALAGALLFACAVPVLAQPSPPPPGDPVRGAQSYIDAGCGVCHGTIGHGGSIAGPKLAPDPVPFFVFDTQLRNPARTMPRYSKELLSDQEAADIYAFLAQRPQGVDPDTIEELRP